MVKITKDLVRRKAEHNEGAIGSLEELSLHMQHIDKLEHLDHWCRDLKILLVQNNIIAKIENVKRLKKLEYLNLSLNIIEKVEGMEGCESLTKLDLTLNFIGDLSSIKSLQLNHNLRNLTLVGNPCEKYEGYRMYVLHMLPQLEELDGKCVTRSERILAAQNFALGLEEKILNQQASYHELRQEQKKRAPASLNEQLADNAHLPDDHKIKKIWSEPSENSPEVRVLMSHLTLKQTEDKEKKPKPHEKTTRKLFNKDGRPLNINDAQLSFEIVEDVESNSLHLKLWLNKSLDTAQLHTDVHPSYVTVKVEDSIFQLVLMEEVLADASKAERSMATGCLVIKMPLVKEYLSIHKKEVRKKAVRKIKQGRENRELLEIGPADREMDYTCIVKHSPDEDFIDDPDIPPLEPCY